MPTNSPKVPKNIICYLAILLYTTVTLSACGDTSDSDGTSVNTETDAGQDFTDNRVDTSTEDTTQSGEIDISLSITDSLGEETPEVLSGIIIITATVSGNQGDLLGVEFFIDEVRLDTDIITPFTNTTNTAEFEDGVHLIQVYTADRQGRSGYAAREVSLDNSPPIFIETSPSDGDGVFFEDGPLNLSLTIDDPSVIDTVTIRANGLLIEEFTEPPFETSAIYEDLYIAEDSLPSNVYVQFEATDNLGQQTIESANVVIYQRLNWKFPTLGAIWASPVITLEGNVIFGNRDDVSPRLYSLYPDGTEYWTYSSSDYIDMAAAVDPDSGRVFFGNTNGEIYGIESYGSQQWSYNIGTPLGGNLTVKDGQLYAAGFNGTVWSFSTGGGVNWSYSLPDYIYASPVAGNDSTVYIGCQDGWFYALRSGSIYWSLQTGGEIWSTPAVGPTGMVFFGSNDGWVYAADSEGNLNWFVEIEGQIWGKLLLTNSNALYVGSTSRYLTRLDPLTGDVVWELATSGLGSSSAVEGMDGTIYVGTTIGEVLAIDPDEGEVLWTYPLGDTVYGSPVVTEDQLYIGSLNRDFYSLLLNVPE